MPRRLRKDAPGTWHHVMSRGIAKRPLFETRRDIRLFLCCLARQVRSGDLEIHAYSILITHFHLLVRSPRGRLSASMQRSLDAYARWFNRSRHRDGPLFRGRFVNRVIESERYWFAVLDYIDRNPVEAGLVANPEDYRFGSAFHYSQGEGPPWLEMEVVQREAGTHRAPASSGALWVAERRLRVPPRRNEDPLDDLIGATPDRVRAWMERKARLADGTAAGQALASPETVLRFAAEVYSRQPDRCFLPGRSGWPWLEVFSAAGLRLLCGLRMEEIGRRLALPRTTVSLRMRMHAEAMAGSPAYRDAATTLLQHSN